MLKNVAAPKKSKACSISQCQRCDNMRCKKHKTKAKSTPKVKEPNKETTPSKEICPIASEIKT